ncbi:hypothetical protein HOLleu_24798 [Holothuria leucospilota]|uniref:Non-haem dioxygenase N-terminal domain-containing protein n=1 Tax=Holothuria leucospilota TaxID=206669 RepID=A0A9Q1BRP0_HOLLE|nr:hypothetical protein HOLleu_24798 [Holothuria leucospilota]
MDSVDFNTESIKIIDFGAYSLERDSPDNIKHLADEIYHAFTTIGFFYLKNTGFPNHVVRSYREI